MQGKGVSVRNLTKGFGASPVLKSVDLQVEPGEFLTLVGPSGCGKSTLLRLIAGLDQADSGTISVDGQAVDHLRPSERNIAMVFQSYALYPHMRVADNIAMPLVMSRLPFVARLPLIGRLVPGTGPVRHQIGAEANEVARLLEIEQLMTRKPGELSGGQRQRVALARAMVRRPGVFLMDEPLSNLDALLRAQVRTELAELHRRLETTFIFVTHDQVEAMTMSRRIAMMMAGEIVQIGTPAEIYGAPDDIRVARFIGTPTINILAGERSPSGRVMLFGNVLQLELVADPGLIRLGIRPEDVQILRPTGTQSGPGNLPARLRHLENLGNEVILYFDVLHEAATEIRARLSARDWGALQQDGGVDALHLNLPANKLIAFDAEGRRLKPQRDVVRRLQATVS
jgi:multiple sugar transport system ATP-binding protein